MQEITELTGVEIAKSIDDPETDAEIKETEMITPAESQMIAIVFSVRTSSSMFSSVHNRRPRRLEWIDTPLSSENNTIIAIPNHVPKDVRESLINVLHGYADVLSMDDIDIGLSTVIEHAILTGNHPLISCALYRYPPAQRAAALKKNKEFEANGWIEPAIRPWSFPVVIVPKKAGGIRFCIDYRKRNDITIKDVYPLPRIDELLDAIGDARFFSKFDIRHGFHHLLVRKEDRPETAFILFEGTWQWVRCPMGICNAPGTFQRAMNMAFQNFMRKTRLAQSIINYCVIVYMDEILVFSTSYEGHVQHIEWALHALKDAGFKVAVEKCQFFLTEISFLGHVVTSQGLQPDPQKVTTVKDALVPISITQVRASLGLASYYRRFVKGFAAIVGPLTNLLKKDQPLMWTPQCDRAFEELKAALISAPVLIRPNLGKPFVLITDWQPEAISAILAQVGLDGLEHVVEYASKTVPTYKRNYAAPTGECYAALWGISHFRAYLYGRKFTLVTDHEPLLALKKSKDYSGMIGRWATILQSMDFDIHHRKHERHGNADGLTRLHRPEKVLKSEEVIPWNEPEEESQSDDSPAPHIVTRTLASYLQWTACLEEPGSDSTLPSRQEYLKPYGIIDHAFYPKEPEALEGEEEVVEEEGDAGEETSEEGSYSEYSEGEQSEEEEELEEEDEEEEAGSEWEDLPEEAACTGTEAEDPAAARRREEIAAEKNQLEIASGASLCINDDLTRDPEPPEPKDGGSATAAPSASRWRRSRSPSPSPPTRPPVRLRTDAGNPPSSPVIIPPSP
ncbi:hypothetical protein CBR_g41190 [Chara braunii]|uniref:Reverse transcriptase domain-containing protein n=1 Tax=Chara braunii TaxID=69332 RepID=A0A388K2M9_CHABU|nr:hypothetical protein CBR_g41190 [Chara braunii]|eukprot:GBG64269.1 hypothetical protein CBR_g41190 [Chara braunii]